MEHSFVPHFQTKREEVTRCTAPLCYKVILQFLRCFIQVSRLLHQFVFLTLSHFCRNFLGKEAARQRSDAWGPSEDTVTHVSKNTTFKMTVCNSLNFTNGILPILRHNRFSFLKIFVSPSPRQGSDFNKEWVCCGLKSEPRT